MSWQKIETAPKDGTVVDLWIRWKDTEGRAVNFSWSQARGEWINEGTGYSVADHFGNLDPVISHWMPKPDRPMRKPDHCLIPKLSNSAKEIRAVHRVFCSHRDSESPDHKCIGVVTMSRDSVVLRCKTCGDAKTRLEVEE